MIINIDNNWDCVSEYSAMTYSFKSSCADSLLVGYNVDMRLAF